MKGRFTRSVALATLFLVAGAAAAHAAESYLEEGLGCADWISSGEYDDPMEGYLIGTSTVTESSTSGVGTSGSIGGGAVPGQLGGSTTDSKTVNETYEIGYYRMSDGSTIRIDCRSYTQA